MASREPPLPTSQGQATFVRSNEKDDVTSIISMAKSLLVDGKLNANGRYQANNKMIALGGD